ncbi:hypothetical protein D3C75_709760 [compost metagenome]
MVAYAFNNDICAGVADGKPFTGNPADISLTAGSTVQRRIPDDDVVLCGEGRLRGRLNDQLAAGKSFADIVIGVTFNCDRDPLRYKCA